MIRIVRSAVLLAALVAIAVFVGYRSLEADAQGTRPNIVLILTDDQDYDSLPVMRKLLSYPRGSWVNFTNGVANDSLCCPARATLLTGQYSTNHLVAKNDLGHLMDDGNTLPVWLNRAGYHTVLVGKYLNGYPWNKPAGFKPPGWDVFDESITHGITTKLTNRAIDYIKAADSPFFLFLSYKAPHKPARPSPLYANADVYVPPDRDSFNEADVSDKPTWIRGLPKLSNDTIALYRTERLNAQRELLEVDDGIDAIVEALEAEGQLDNTMIIFASDNGFSWGNHRRYGKWCAYDVCSHIPFFVRYPGLVESRIEPGPVSLVDIAGTIAAYAGVTPGLPQDGRNLLPLISGQATNWPDGVLLEKKLGSTTSYFAIRTPRWKYVEYKNGEKELYDLEADSDELFNLAGQPEYATTQTQLAAQLAEMRPGGAVIPSYTVSGRVTTADGTGIRDVVVSAGGGKQATTAADGSYTLRGLAAGTVTLTPSKANTTFEPPSDSVAVPPNATGVDFTGTSTVTYKVSGIVKEAGKGVAGVVISADGTFTTTTDARGRYTLLGLPAGTVTLTPSKANTTFDLPSASVAVPPNATGVNFVGSSPQTYKLSGTVTKAGRGVVGVTISAGGLFTTTTGAGGRYTLQDLPPGTFTLTPTLAGLYFTPESLVVTVPPNRTGRDFKAVTGFNIVGQVTTSRGTPIRGAMVEVGEYRATTGSTGTYRLLNLPPGTYTLTVSQPGYVFNPPAPVTVPPDARRVNIIGVRE